MEYIKKAYRFVVRSSADPRRTSLTFKSAALGSLTIISGNLIQALDVVCQFGYRCYYFDPSLVDHLRMMIDQIAEGIYYALLLVAIVGSLIGATRKLYRTIVGTNLTLQ